MRREDREKIHWADDAAKRIIKVKGDKEIYTLAAGITPSGIVHIGNFRELITVELVKRALEKRGKKVRFIFSWDDYDVFRKVPANLPPDKRAIFPKWLGKSISAIPDPFTEEKSYAAYFEKKLENSLEKVKVCPEFLYQSEKYSSGEYKERIKFVLKRTATIKQILNQFRSSPLGEKWYPVTIFCKQCQYDQTSVEDYDDNDLLVYFCLRCSKKFPLDLRKDFNLKLLWRIDWPMRWQYEKVDFEPGGKDHSSEGGSYDTAKLISREIFDYEPPVYLRYDFVLTKGRKSKLSSSSGEVITLDDLLEIYQAEIVRWIFSSYKNNVDFTIAFDLDVIKIYEAYDRMERQFYQKEPIPANKINRNRFIFELSQLEKHSPPERQQFPFRHLTNISQINEFSVEGIKRQLNEKEAINQDSLPSLEARLRCVRNWIEKYAPEDFKFLLNEKKVNWADHLGVEVGHNYQKAILELKDAIERETYRGNDKEMANYLYALIEQHGLEAKKFFKLLYWLLISKEQGPKLGHFLNLIEKEKLLKLL